MTGATIMARRKEDASLRREGASCSKENTEDALAFDKEKEFGKEAEILKVLGHPIRLKIVAGLCTQECNVKHIWECLGLPQATVSQHLALLKHKGIIEGNRDGVEVFYTVVHPMVRRLMEVITA